MAALPPGIIPIPDYLYYLLIGMSLLAILLAFFLVLVTMWTPAGTWIKARLLRRKIFFLWGRDGLGSFRVPNKKEENDYAFFKKLGPIGISRDSHIFEAKTKQTIYLADKDIGATIQRDWPRLVEQLKLKFPKELKSGKDLKKIVEEAEKYTDNEMKNPELVLKGSTIRVSELSQLFPLNLKPLFIEGYAEVARREERRKADTMKYMFGFAILVICIGIAGYLLISQANKEQTQCKCDFGGISEICQVAGGTPKTGIESLNGSMQVIQEIKPTQNQNPGGRLS